jgi:hypothetical protein
MDEICAELRQVETLGESSNQVAVTPARALHNVANADDGVDGGNLIACGSQRKA